MKEDGKILIQDINGVEKTCDILFTFDSKETNKSYIVYTDNELDDLGNIKVYANIYDAFSDSGNLLPVETEEEWTLIEQIFSSINKKEE